MTACALCLSLLVGCDNATLQVQQYTQRQQELTWLAHEALPRRVWAKAVREALSKARLDGRFAKLRQGFDRDLEKLLIGSYYDGELTECVCSRLTEVPRSEALYLISHGLGGIPASGDTLESMRWAVQSIGSRLEYEVDHAIETGLLPETDLR